MEEKINYYGVDNECVYLERLITEYLNEEENEFKRGLIFGISGALFVIGVLDYITYRYIMKLMGM